MDALPYIIRDWTIDIVINSPKNPLSHYAKFANPKDAIGVSDEMILANVREDMFTNLESFFHSFGKFPQHGSFMANELKIPLMMLTNYIDGTNNVMVFMFHVSEDQEENTHYAFRHMN